jgi:NitT/TauT family transport system substrate-binding protein
MAKRAASRIIDLIPALAALLISNASAFADPVKIHIACTATSDCASAMIARDEGLFAKHNLDADLTLIPINTNIPPAIASNSIQIGGPTAPVFLQAVDGGLDLVAVAGASIMDPVANSAISAMTRNGLTITDAKGFVGKKVGAPGIGAYLQVLFSKWLIEKGVDPKSVNFVEVTFPTMSDALKSGSVDAVLTAEPFISRIQKAGTGQLGPRYAQELGGDHPIISYVAGRAFAEGNPEVIKNFRAAIEEGAAIVNADRDKTSESVSKFTKVPLEIVKLNRASISHPALKGADFAWWLTTMKQQDMLQSDIDLNKLVLP